MTAPSYTGTGATQLTGAAGAAAAAGVTSAAVNAAIAAALAAQPAAVTPGQLATALAGVPAGVTQAQAAAIADQQAAAAITAQTPALIMSKMSSRRIWSMLTPQAGDTIAATTTETPFTSRWTCPANSLVLNQSIRMWGSGTFTTTAVVAPNQRARIRFGSTLLIDSGLQPLVLSALAGRYDYDCTFVVRAVGVNGLIEARGRLEFANALGGTTVALCGPSGTTSDTGNPVTVDTTQAADLALSVQFSAAIGSNSNSLRTQNILTLIPTS